MAEYGIRITLPPDDPMRASHLLGPDWEVVHWFETRGARDRAYREMLRLPGYYRVGDRPSLVLERIERPGGAGSPAVAAA